MTHRYATPSDGRCRLEPLPLPDVQAGGAIGERIERTIAGNLLKLDLQQDFIAPFRNHSSSQCYVGLGKQMDAAVHFAQHPLHPELVRYKDELFKAIIATQEADGYIGIMQKEQRIWEPFDLHDEVHIVSALLEDHRCFGSEESLHAAEKLLSLLMAEYRNMPANQGLYGLITKHMMGLGFEHALLNMYALTHDPKYLEFCLQQCGLDELCWPIQLERHPPLHGHSYMYLNLALAHLRVLAINGDTSHLRHPMLARDFMLYGNGTSIIGGVGIAECWTNDQNGRGDHCETCSTAYQLRFFSRLMQLTEDSVYGDVMERMLYNALFAAQSPDGRQIRYYTPVEGKRGYWPMDTYCCPNNFRRIMAELPGMLVYKVADGKGALFNFYSTAEAKLKLAGTQVRIAMETDYPVGEEIMVRIDPEAPARFRLRFRIPLWCTEATLQLEGQPPRHVQGGSFAEAEQLWLPGSAIRLRLPMTPRFVAGRARQSGLCAVMRGPVVYTLDPANCGRNPKHSPKDANLRAGEIDFVPDAALDGMESADLTTIRLDADSLSVNPDGSIQVLADKDATGIGVQRLVQLRLTPFHDPDGLCSYFHLSDTSRAVQDELFQ